MRCLYHKNCSDGKAAALAVWLKYGDEGNEYIPVQYGEPPPEGLEGEDVIIVDFSYKQEVLRELAEACRSVVLLDHHTSALRELKDASIPSVTLHLDMSKSGCVLAWEYFHNEPVPKLFKLIQDRDLWKFEYGESTKNVATGLLAYPDWQSWISFIRVKGGLSELSRDGIAINRFLDIQMDRIIEEGPADKEYLVPVYNLPGFLTSETLSRALKKYPDAPYAKSYSRSAGKMFYSLRSRPGSDVDVSKIAEKAGGGGHKHAAGYAV